LFTLRSVRYHTKRKTQIQLVRYTFSGLEFHQLTQPGLAWRTANLHPTQQENLAYKLSNAFKIETISTGLLCCKKQKRFVSFDENCANSILETLYHDDRKYKF
jgi:hypothetical protein